MKKLIALTAVAAVAGCGSSSSSTHSTSAPAKTKSTSTTAAVSNSSSSKITVQMHDNYFGPKTISGKPGSTVTVELKNVGQVEHNFKIDGQKSADADVEPGEDGKATVKIPTSGSVQFYCEYHKGLGMVGTVKAS